MLMSITDTAHCTATAKATGERCRQPAVKGSTKCRMHGGTSPTGIGSPRFRTGRYSKEMPARLAARYGEALADSKLLELRDEIALVQSRQAELLTHLDVNLALRHWQNARIAYGEVMAASARQDAEALQAALAVLGRALDAGSNDYAVWNEILETSEHRRRLVESEHKRLVAMQQMISTEQAMVLLARVVDTVRRHVADRDTLAAISADFRTILVREPGG